ncbi:glutamate 5-kinase [Parasphingopyxis sp. CP4]|uniref:glutamate 5-kinase n=1 Tax=Parasphingopyxis sp. CP4 TaxID=2724527 RepID=UPI0015A2FBB1|nr:glutamate 5-kinase [Parasphingopyxis sp. CP4]QLC20740.1 glutamate 5-kinase [Parasphingopyxis sp. CP4]
MFGPRECPRLVVKIGSSLLVSDEGRIRRDWLSSLVSEVAERQANGQKIILVSSGAIALGARLLGLEGGGRKSLDDAQASAAAGQIALSQCWAELLDNHGIKAAQMLVTLGDLEERRSYLNAAATLDRLLRLEAVPLINENDSVATQEIRFGDNDRLAARIGQAARADGIILLSDVAGLFSADPKSHEDAELINTVEHLDDEIVAMAQGTSGMGSGGMKSKIEAARIATTAGIPLAIISGQHQAPLSRYAESGTGTVFAAEGETSAREAWMAGRLTAAGRIVVDSGAVTALRDGNSLLPAGVTTVEGSFDRGDIVDIVDESGNLIGRGLVEYASAAVDRIKGHKSTDLESILGYAPRPALVHRNHMVTL